jgi:DNA-directed RNA polymerase I subunit RPA2
MASPYRHVQVNSPLGQWTSEALKNSVQAHVESYNTFMTHMLTKIPAHVSEVEMIWPDQQELRVWFEDLQVSKPVRSDDCTEPRIFPFDCRESHQTYGGELTARIAVQIGRDGVVQHQKISMGSIPIMVGSIGCHLNGLNPEQLVRCKEDPDERGGYFILNGNEKVVRLLVQPKANYVHALIRPSFANRGPLYTKFATQMRCMRDDLTTQTLSLHYRKDGTCWVRFSILKNEYLLPMFLLLKAFFDCSDQVLFERLTDGYAEDTFVSERVMAMLEAHRNTYGNVQTQADAQSHLGEVFSIVMDEGRRADKYTKRQVGKKVINRFMFVHTDNYFEKFSCLLLMFRKLVALVRGDIRPDNADATDAHDVLLPGQLFGSILKEALELSLQKMVATLQKKNRMSMLKNNGEGACLPLNMPLVISTKKTEYFLSTGNLSSKTGLDLMQVTGFTIIADKLNAFRYFSHFRSIHRGAFFAEMKTTTVRKLLPETWGFLCPVHTPDGGPCGLLNHLSALARVTAAAPDPERTQKVIDAALSLGVLPVGCQTITEGAAGSASKVVHVSPVYPANTTAWVTVDGKVIGKVALGLIQSVAVGLKEAKRCNRIPADTEVVSVTREEGEIGIYPGIWLFTGPGRLVRPVICLQDEKREWIGPMEQIHMQIAVGNEHNKKFKDVPENLPVVHTHKEVGPTSIFSFLAALTPFCNHNQSPRNMYQCQMLKQTMGTPYLNHAFRTDNKVYRIHYPQAPMIRTKQFTEGNFDLKPFGANAVVAVISHTGYDMEDALIINKASFDRGFGHASVYKTKVVDASPEKFGSSAARFRFFNDPSSAAVDPSLQADGLPHIGIKVGEGDALMNVTNVDTGFRRGEKYKDEEEAWVEQINVISGGGFGSLSTDAQRVSMKLRIPRNPVAGDKFASRHGQKGVMSMLWPQEDMPFTASGITPDIRFNPHGFPSRMTIGMLIETMAGKANALDGKPLADATAFKEYPAGKNAHDEFGAALAKHGYQYLGTEEMYSGMHGTLLTTQIFVGVVYYQRLRHMVLDKAQVRATGPIDPLTKQPVKGRKRHGGIRFGEMERDSILSHGGAFLLRDRLFNCSDYHVDSICPKCGNILSAVAPDRDSAPTCIACNVSCKQVEIPFVFRYLCAELASMNIKIKLDLREKDPEEVGI